jgi:hypothetical protein
MGFASDYVDVASRIKLLLDKYPQASITCTQPRVINLGDRVFIEVQALVECNDGSGRTAQAAAWEPYPGRTNFTRDSEMMNAETSAVGRACGMLGIGLNTSVASLDEVRARKRETDDDAAARYHSSPAVSRSEAPKRTAGPGPATEKQIGFLKRLSAERGIDIAGIDLSKLTAAECSDMIETAKNTPKLN